MVLNSLFIKSNDATGLFDMPKSSKFNNTSYLFSDIVKICNENLSDANPAGTNVLTNDNSAADKADEASAAPQELVKTISSAGNLTELIQQLLGSLNISGQSAQASGSKTADSKLSGIEVLFKDDNGKTEKTLQFPFLLLNPMNQVNDLPAGSSSAEQKDFNQLKAAAQQIVENLQALMKSGGPVKLYINSGNTSLKLDILQMTGGSGKATENEIVPLPVTGQTNQAGMQLESAAGSDQSAESPVTDNILQNIKPSVQTSDSGKIISSDSDNKSTSKTGSNPEGNISENIKTEASTNGAADKNSALQDMQIQQAVPDNTQQIKIPVTENELPLEVTPQIKAKGNSIEEAASKIATRNLQTVKENSAEKVQDANSPDEGFVVKLSSENTAAHKTQNYITAEDLSLLNDYDGKQLEGIIVKQTDVSSNGAAFNATSAGVFAADETTGGSMQGRELFYNLIDKDLKQSLEQLNDQSAQTPVKIKAQPETKPADQNAASLNNLPAETADANLQPADASKGILTNEEFSIKLKESAGVGVKTEPVSLKDVKEAKIAENQLNDNQGLVKTVSVPKQALKNADGLSYSGTEAKKSGTDDGKDNQSDLMVKAGDALTRGIKTNNLQETSAAHRSADTSSAGNSANQSAQAVTAGSGSSNTNTGRDQSKDSRGNNDFQGSAVQNASQSINLNTPAAKAQPKFSQYVENPVPVTPSEMMKEVTGLIQRGESGTVVLKLKPETLGKVKVEINVSDNAVHAHIEVDNDAVRQIVQSNISSLKQSLNLNGLQLSGINVSVSNQNSKWGSGGAPRKKQNFAHVQNVSDESVSPAATKSLGYNTYEYLA